jgi:hypothetical protein
MLMVSTAFGLPAGPRSTPTALPVELVGPSTTPARTE